MNKLRPFGVSVTTPSLICRAGLAAAHKPFEAEQRCIGAIKKGFIA